LVPVATTTLARADGRPAEADHAVAGLRRAPAEQPGPAGHPSDHADVVGQRPGAVDGVLGEDDPPVGLDGHHPAGGDLPGRVGDP
jgi:hypothetical protein